MTLADLHTARYGAMVRLATLLTGSAATAEEIVQDCFVRLFARFGSIRDPEPYLRRAVVNASYSARRRMQRERRQRTTAPPPAELGADELLDALDALPARQRAALILQFYEDLPGEQIALALGCRPGTVKSLVHRGLARLREELGE